ncbi:MAG: GNAT family N-acetyltransferase [Rhizobiales bacterium PAR1]|nr:MAG: GNAT family N-acetyltransferase [Rhizobiales bacterium PAR1]
MTALIAPQSFAAALFDTGSALKARVLEGAEALDILARARGHATPFQSARWLESFLVAHLALTDFRLIEISDVKGNALLLPLRKSRHWGGNVGEKIGEGHASYFFPVLAGETSDWPQEALRAALTAAGREAGFDAFLFEEAPLTWMGHANPLAELPHQPAPSEAAGLTLMPDAEALLARLSDRDDRKKLRQKSSKLAAFGELRTGWVTRETEIRAVLAQYFSWKAGQFAALGITDPFAEPEIRAFLEAATLGDTRAIRLYTLHAGERLLAVLGGALGAESFSGMFTAYDPDAAVARYSPGEVLLVALIRTLCSEGAHQFDLGVGEARYKAHYCPETIALADIAVPVSGRGRILAAMWRLKRGLKRKFKQNEAAFGLLKRLRRRLR